MKCKMIALLITGGGALTLLVGLSLFWKESEPLPIDPYQEEERLARQWDVYQYGEHFVWYPAGQKPFATNPPHKLIERGLTLKEIQKRYVERLHDSHPAACRRARVHPHPKSP